MTASEIDERNKSLNVDKVFNDADLIHGISGKHCVKIVKDKATVYASTVYAANEAISETDETSDRNTESNDTSVPTDLEPCVIAVGDWFAVEYDGLLHPGEIKSVEANDFQVSVMVQAGKYWKWTVGPDKIFYPQEKLIKKLNTPSVVNSRGHFQFSNF